jgi:hypothetical protein
MPLPNVANLISGPIPNGMPPAACNTPPVSATSNAKFSARNGRAHWVGNKLTLQGDYGHNYWYIPQAAAGEAHYCVVPCGGNGPDAYVISDNYGGCEYHEAYNAAYNILAFFHVFRGGGQVAQYQLAPGWVQRSVIRSSVIAQTLGSNWSISCINRGANPPVVQSKFIRVGGYPNLAIQAEDNGTTPYPPGPGLFQQAMAALTRLFS